MPNDLTPPKKTAIDHAHEAVRESLNLATGGLGGKLFDKIIGPPIEKRRDEWREEVGNRIMQLETDGRVDVESLMKNEKFISTLMQASHAALRTHQQEKLAALQSAVLNTAIGNAPDESRQQLFIRWIEELTPLHIRVLEYFRHGRHYPRTLAEAVEWDFPESKALHIAGVIVNDLVARELVQSIPVTGIIHKKRDDVMIKPLGGAFLSFIRDPLATS